MLKGAFSHLNPVSKLLLLIILVFSFLLFSLLLGILVLVPFFGSGVISLIAAPDFADPAIVNALKVVQMLNTAGGLLLPAIVFMWLCNRPDSGTIYRLPQIPWLLAASAALIIVAQPVVGLANELNSHLALPGWLSDVETWMKDKENINAQVTEAFLSTTSNMGFLINVLMIAILPALAEEILFRGALAGLLKDWTKNVHVAVLISSLVFAAIHLQFYGFLPRFLLGMVLGYLFFWSGSIWLPVVAHFTNNFLSVFIEFIFRKGYIHTNAENFGTNNAAWITLLSVTAISATIYFIHSKSVAKNPLNH
jgi:membrane protease YdiL (CAAX protease family)